MTDINRLHNARTAAHRTPGPPARPTGFEPRHRERMPAGADLIRTVDGVELPVAGLWNIPSGWAAIELEIHAERLRTSTPSRSRPTQHHRRRSV